MVICMNMVSALIAKIILHELEQFHREIESPSLDLAEGGVIVIADVKVLAC